MFYRLDYQADRKTRELSSGVLTKKDRTERRDREENKREIQRAVTRQSATGYLKEENHE